MNTTVEWILIRATGLTAVVMLTASMVLGLMLSLRLRSRRWPAIVTNDLHRYVTGLALWVVGAHVTLLVVDSYVNIRLRDVVVPFAADTRTIATGFGTLAFLALTLVWFTSINRGSIGQRTWRALHYLTFVAYALAMAHGIFGGTDTRRIWAWPLYLGSLLIVGSLTWRRIRTARQAKPARRPSPVAQVERSAGAGTGRSVPATRQSGVPIRPAPVAQTVQSTALPALDARPLTRTVRTQRRGPVRL